MRELVVRALFSSFSKSTTLTRPLCAAQLYAEENPFVPVAWYRTAKRTSPVAAAGDVIEPPSLSIQPEGERIQDFVLASLLIVEQKYRMAAKSVRVATGFRNAPATPVPAIN